MFMSEYSQSAVSQEGTRCPYLGLHDDAKTSLAYPSPWNHCHRTNPSSAVSVSHQANACLTDKHKQCEVYCSNTPKGLPKNLRAKFSPVERNATSGNVVFWVVIGFLLLVGLFSVLIGGQWNMESSLSKDVLETSTNTLASDEPDNLSPAISPINTGMPDTTPNTTHVASRVCGHELDAIFGDEDRFVLHRIAIGENLDLYANRFQTSTNAILYINYEIQIPVWENAVIVIPVGITVGAGFPFFETFEQESIKISVDELAKQLNTDAQLFRRYNGFDETCSEFSGWMLIPHKRNRP
jgi:hypothetical protein